MAADDTEITLGTGKLLGLFFILAAICGVFFAIGYSLGKTSAREQALNDRPAESGQIAASSVEPQTAKPSAAVKAAQTEPAPIATDIEAAKSEPDLTFYKAVKQNAPDTGASAVKPLASAKAPATGAEGVAAPGGQVPHEREGKLNEGGASESEPSAAKVETLPAATSPRGTSLVQVAAVSHEEDAAALAGALRKKGYGASVVNNPAGKDKLYHVVIGPFASLQDAEATKAKLLGDGYNAIVKR